MTAAQPEEIAIPDELLPADGRFGSGPSKVRPESLAALAATGATYLGTSHRQPTVKSVVARIRGGLRELFALPDGYAVVLGNGGSTAFWDVATFALIERRSQHVVCGEFSAKFAAAVRAAPFLDDPDLVSAEPGTRADAVADAAVDAYALTHNETSTGVVMPVQRPGAPDTALVLVDATSAAGAIEVAAADYDAYYFAPQKVFASDGGVWLALCSPAALDRARRLTDERWVPPSLDLTIAADNSELDQTYNTPALATLFLFADQLEWLLDRGGLAWSSQRCRESAAVLYGWADASPYAEPFVKDPDARSPVVGTVDFDPAVDANVLSRVLRANGIVDTESYRKLGRNQLRIGMYPAVDPADVGALTACIDYVATRLH
ncbi:MAG: phosphoserine transaminase [Mycobacteriales bacterium]|nr:phosphoserine transaminase [Frankia sp.]